MQQGKWYSLEGWGAATGCYVLCVQHRTPQKGLCPLTGDTFNLYKGPYGLLVVPRPVVTDVGVNPSLSNSQLEPEQGPPSAQAYVLIAEAGMVPPCWVEESASGQCHQYLACSGTRKW